MRMLEEYVGNIDTVWPDGTTYRELFSDMCLYIVPMDNPDGVMISQFGVNGAVAESTRNWLYGFKSAGYSLTQIKANSNGVDINRNFPVGFGEKGRFPWLIS